MQGVLIDVADNGKARSIERVRLAVKAPDEKTAEAEDEGQDSQD